VLLDYGDVLMHVFLEDTRAYYALERLWATRRCCRVDGGRRRVTPSGCKTAIV